MVLQTALARTAPTSLKDTTLLVAKRDNDTNEGQNPGNQLNPNIPPYQGQMPPNMDNAPDFQARSQFRNKLQNEGKNTQRYSPEQSLGNFTSNGENWLHSNTFKVPRSTEALVSLSPLVALWLEPTAGEERLAVLRLVHVNDKDVCQGIILDAPQLQALLAEEVTDLFSEAHIVPMREEVAPNPERTMTALPFELDPGPPPPPPAQAAWTPLRVGLALAWLASLVALAAVGLGGWSLLDLSERRIRFVSAVTHELRTPLTTLRLYLDMLMNGLVRDEKQRAEYIRTLHAEADRLNRLVSNVLDFSRLEKQHPRLALRPARTADLLGQAQATWQGRCQDAAKELVLENADGPEIEVVTDGELLQQVLGNLLDNACKYSRGAEDPRLWLRVRRGRAGVVFEVEDRGPGVAPAERRSIFRAFRRGRSADVTAGGVGLGLALAYRWTRLLGGKLRLRKATAEGGACFQVYLPVG
jgi:signal transduction histidine kinase